MNLQAIRAIRRKFVAISTLTYFLVMLFMGLFINLANIISTRGQINAVLDYLVENDGVMPESRAEEEREINREALYSFAPEFRFSARFFSAAFDSRGYVEAFNTDNIREITPGEALNMAKEVFASGTRSGRRGFYYYRSDLREDGRVLTVFLNCRTQITLNARILYTTLLIAAAGLIITFILVNLISYRVIRPEIENISRQKQFITNASHELKTPLAVIRANTEIEEMMNGESEWTQSTMRQVDRLNGLVQNLVMIARAQEKEDRSVMEEIDVTRGVEETVKPYESLAQQEKKSLELDLQRGVRMCADESKIRQITSILIDNAFKYCDEGGRIRVTLVTLRKGKTVRLSVSNSFSQGSGVNYARFFERFYREDESHNVDRGGYGIGLSIAESICHQYGGQISASWKDGEICFTSMLPAGGRARDLR